MIELFEMSEQQRDRIMAASKPVPLIYLSGGTPAFGSQQENANSAWQAVAKELGFKWDTVSPASGKADRFFYAVPSMEVTND